MVVILERNNKVVILEWSIVSSIYNVQGIYYNIGTPICFIPHLA